jgi:hypothetical protein
MITQFVCVYIKSRFLLEFNATQSHQKLHAVYCEGCRSYCTVLDWVYRFSAGRDSLKDDLRSGRSIAAITEQNIASIPSAKHMVDMDPFANSSHAYRDHH